MTHPGAAPAAATLPCQPPQPAQGRTAHPVPQYCHSKHGRGRVGKPLWQVVEEVQDEWFEEEMEVRPHWHVAGVRAAGCREAGREGCHMSIGRSLVERFQ